MKASDLYPREYKNFHDIPKLALPLLNADFIRKLQKFRTNINAPIYANPNISGWVREYGNPKSRHYAVDRLSDAGDVFTEKWFTLHLWYAAIQNPDFNGIGLYLDTKFRGKPHPMIHLDTRPLKKKYHKVMWIRENLHEGTYYHNLHHPRFNECLVEVKKMIDSV